MLEIRLCLLKPKNIKKIIYVLFIFGCAGSLLLWVGFPYSLVACVGFSRRSFQALEHKLNICGTGAEPLCARVFLDQWWSLCLLGCQADSLPLNRQGSP